MNCKTMIIPFLVLATAVPISAQSDLTDAQVRRSIEADLFGAKGVSGHDVDVVVVDGIVTLDGEVDSILAQERAVRIASMIKGVRSVVDRITVAPNTDSDADIRGRILGALRKDPATDSWEIGVTVEDGAVTLTGTVDSFAERELTETVTKGVRGVRSVVNDITVATTGERTDREILNDVQQRIIWNAHLDGRPIEVEVEDGVVKLKGAVGSAHERVLARMEAWVAGVEAVDTDELEVRWWLRDDMQAAQRWHQVGDDAIRDAIDTAFLHDPRVLSFEPEVSVEDGIVTLQGRVSSVKARRAAAEDAANTVGVWKVRNHLKVVPHIDVTDALVAADVREALQRDVLVHDEDISVAVTDGVARLSGDVDSYFAREQAEDVAARVSGVREIDNRLAVDYPVPVYSYTFYDWDPRLYDYDFDYSTVRVRPDWEIESDIRDELWWSAFVDSDQVDVDVEQGVATLTGTVDSWLERRFAAENAIEGGAFKVVNRLRVAGPNTGS